MIHFDDDDTTAGSTATAAASDETELAHRACAGDKQAFDQLFDLYFARTSSYFSVFARREAKAAVKEVLTELFASLGTPSDLSLAERAYRLARASAQKRAALLAVAKASKVAPAKVAIPKHKPAKARTRPALP
jgi:hypothetical protein